MVCFPNAKINLGLNIAAKRADGYHDIETIFYPIDLKDVLEIIPALQESGTFKQTGIQLDSDPGQNLVVKAYQLLKKQFDLPEVDIYLLKKIPFGAGLGGGSSDAAFMLKLLNEYAQLHLSDEDLEKLAVQIGADCPFFIKNKPVFATGTGNVFTQISLTLEDYRIVLVKPDIYVSTKDAYKMIQPGKPVCPLMEVIELPVQDWKGLMVNDFEQSVFQQFPAIERIKKLLYETGALYASMSGSGSSVFGIFDKSVNCDIHISGCSVFMV